jgi:peptidoglycan L-alanyl-D-glutamate endopeptidase CwlK
MGQFYLGKTSLSRLEGVHPDLVRVVKRAIEITPIDFGVTEGLRTVEKQEQYVAEGKSTTMNSRHLPQDDNYSHAIDLYCRDNTGKVTWEHKWFRLVIQAMMTAAIEEGVQIKAGGLWRTFLDSPHFELNKEYYN